MLTSAAPDAVWQAAAAFRLPCPPRTVEPIPGGRIHATYRLRCEASHGAAVLQRLNRHVFPDPLKVVENVARVTDHLQARLRGEGRPEPHRHALTLLRAWDGRPYHVDADGEWWRAYVHVAGGAPHEGPLTPRRARSAARAFGEFIGRLTDLPPPPLEETIPGFHDTTRRLEALDRAASEDPLGRAAEAQREVEDILSRRGLARTISTPLASGVLPSRTVHNDTKVTNVLFDTATGEALCVLDLDTVMPGTPLHDFGDLVRSAAALGGEDPAPGAGPGFSLVLFEALTEGYLEGTGTTLTETERELLPMAPHVLALELAARFLTDHLEGDRYFAAQAPGDNLRRCRAQLELLSAMEAQGETMTRVVAQAVAEAERRRR